MTADSDQSPEAEEQPSLFRGPANWFTLLVPARFRLQQSEAIVEISPRFEDNTSAKTAQSQPLPIPWSLSLYAAWVEDGEPETSAASFSPATLFPGVLKCEAGAPLRIDAPASTWTGWSMKSQGPWWLRWLRKRNMYEWRLWVIEHGHIIIVASLQSRCGHPLQDDTVTACTGLLNTIRFADVQAKPPELFRQEVVQLARKHFPLLTTETTGNFGIRINESEIRLTNFYRTYLQAPERISQIVLPGLTTVVRLQEWGPDQLMPPLSVISDRLMPMLYPEEEAVNSLNEFVRIPWVAGLCVMFVIDEDDSYRFVHQKMLETWQVTLEQLEELAMENLHVYAQDNPLEVTLVGEDGDPRMLVPLKPNAYNSVRLLGDQLHGRLRQMLGAELVVGVPNRDFFVAVSLSHPQLIGEVRQQVAQDYQSMHHPLTSRLLVISADGVSEYCEP